MIKGLISLLTILFGNPKTLTAEEFKLAWEYTEDNVTFTVSAPTKGWVAVGFTADDKIVATNLIMQKVDDDLVYGEDQFVTGMGQHPTINSLGGVSRISNIQGTEKGKQTTVSFTIPAKKLDQYHFDLSEGNEINIWLAWSISDDFDHHSRKRILRTLKL